MITLSLGLPIMTGEIQQGWNITSKVIAMVTILLIDATYLIPMFS